MSSNRQRQLAAEIARKKVLAVYSSAADKINRRIENYYGANQPYNTTQNPTPPPDYTQAPIYQQPQPNVWQSSGNEAPMIQHSFNNLSYQNPYYTNQNQPSYNYPEQQNSPYAPNNYSQPEQNYHNSAAATQNSYNPDTAYTPNPETENTTPTPENRRAERYDRKYGDELDREIQELETMDEEEETWNQETIPNVTSISNEFTENNYPTDNTQIPSALKDTPIDAGVTVAEWEQYHSAWQNYYQKYYNDYYSKAAQTYLATEKMKDERIATGKKRKAKHARRLVPLFIIGIIALVFLFLQYNRLIFAPIMAYIAPDNGNNVTTNLEAVNPNINQPVSPEPRLIIPKLNIDVPVAFDIHFNDVMEAMNYGVAHYSIPGANALPGQIGNFVITGHSAGDIYSSNPYKFIFSGLERLEDGDLIYVNYNSVRYTYQMVRRETVEPSNVAALIYETDKPMLTLITCTPLGTSRYRLLITAEQISPTYEGATDEGEDNTTSIEDDIRENEQQNVSMPSNEPSFFEGIWNWLTGKS